MDSLSLYDLLVGCFVSRGDNPADVPASYFNQMTEDEKLRSSIIENLKMVLQTRRGSVMHLPDFGIPDIRQIYFDEGSIESVPDMIKETILKYEPRLKNVRVQRKDFDEKNLRISLEIAAQIKEVSGREILFTEFSSTGWTKVYFERESE